jgi:hypothetical protein
MATFTHPEIEKAWLAFMKAVSGHYEEIEPKDMEMLRAISHVADPPMQYEDDDILVLPGH